METRARKHGKKSLPPELWCIILSHLTPQEVSQAASVSHEFAIISRPAAETACERLFPHHRHRVVNLLRQGKLGVQKVISLVNQHESEAAAHPDVHKANQVQKLVLPEHRQIAVEWLIEVAWDWQLESTVVYRGAQYLDHYLASVPVQALSKFQMLAISTLRTALKHSSKLAERERAKLPYKIWAEVTDGACTEADVRSTCTKLDRLLQQKHRDHPNAKQRLRYLWYRLYEAGVVKQEHVYIYMLASFLLHLSILDSSLSSVTPTLLATAALSLSLEVFRFSPWPAVLQEHCLYLHEDLQEPQDMLRRTQEELPAEQLRSLWLHSYSYIGTNPIQQPAYSHLQLIVKQKGLIKQLDVALNSSGLSPRSSCTTAQSAAVESAATAATTAAAMANGLAAAVCPADGTLITGIPPATASGSVFVQVSAPVGRVTRAAAAAGQHQLQQRQQQNISSALQAATSSSHAVSLVAGNQQQPQQLGLGDRSLPTPQRTSLAPVGAGAVEHVARAGPAAAVGAASLMAGLAGGPSSWPMDAAASTSSAAAAAFGAGGSARRPTRELPARRAVASSRYGCRSSAAAGQQVPGCFAAAAADSSSNAAAAAVLRPPVAAAVSHGSLPPGMLTAGAAASGSMTPAASPKHTPASGYRGLAALFAGAAAQPAATSGVRTRSADLMLQAQLFGGVEPDKLIEGTPQPLQLMTLQLSGKGQDTAHPVNLRAGKGLTGLGSAAAGIGIAGGLSSTGMLAACHAAGAAAQ